MEESFVGGAARSERRALTPGGARFCLERLCHIGELPCECREVAKRPAPIVHVIEHAEFHAASRRVDHGPPPPIAALRLEWDRVAGLHNFERRLA